MSVPGPGPHEVVVVEPLVDAQEVQFWMEKAVGRAAGEPESPETQRDLCLHLGRLRDFLQVLLTHMSNMTCYQQDMDLSTRIWSTW
ncbi:hypothetical protein CRUP_024982 [Coryphaenoides rupestris]|nr:hypothetical protein CRUP_024982 [Coryphaenoides rupestris]